MINSKSMMDSSGRVKPTWRSNEQGKVDSCCISSIISFHLTELHWDGEDNVKLFLALQLEQAWTFELGSYMVERHGELAKIRALCGGRGMMALERVMYPILALRINFIHKYTHTQSTSEFVDAGCPWAA